MWGLIAVGVVFVASHAFAADDPKLVVFHHDVVAERWLQPDLAPPEINCPDYQVLVPAVANPLLELALTPFGVEVQVPPVLIHAFPRGCGHEDKETVKDTRRELAETALGLVARGVAGNLVSTIESMLSPKMKFNVNIDVDEVSVELKIKF